MSRERHALNTLKKGVMVFNATFNNISVISWRSVLLVEETGVDGENHRPVALTDKTVSHNVVSSNLKDVFWQVVFFKKQIICILLKATLSGPIHNIYFLSLVTVSTSANLSTPETNICLKPEYLCIILV